MKKHSLSYANIIHVIFRTQKNQLQHNYNFVIAELVKNMKNRISVPNSESIVVERTIQNEKPILNHCDRAIRYISTTKKRYILSARHACTYVMFRERAKFWQF